MYAVYSGDTLVQLQLLVLIWIRQPTEGWLDCPNFRFIILDDVRRTATDPTEDSTRGVTFKNISDVEGSEAVSEV
jgi:hypothetical protein